MAISRFSFVGIAVFWLLVAVSGPASETLPPSAAPPEQASKRSSWLFRQRFGTGPATPGIARFPSDYRSVVPTVSGHRLWTSLGPTSIVDGQIGLSGQARNVAGRVTVVKAYDKDRWLAGTAAGGIWRTMDGGKTWCPTRLLDDHPGGTADGDFTPRSLAIGAIAFAPPPSTLVYAGTGDPSNRGDSYGGTGLLISADLGETWRRLTVLVSTDGDRRDATEVTDWFLKAVGSMLVLAQPDGRGDGHHIWFGTRPANSTFFAGGAGAICDDCGLYHAYVPATLSLPDQEPRACGASAGPDRPPPPRSLTVTLLHYGPVWDLKANPANGACVYAGRNRDMGAGQLPGVFRYCLDHERPIDPPEERRLVRTDYEPVKIAVANDDTLYYYSHKRPRPITDQTLSYFKNARQCQEPTPSSTSTHESCGSQKIPFSPQPDKTYCSWDPSSPNPGRPDCKTNNVLSVHPQRPHVIYAGGVALWKYDPTQKHPWTDVSHLTPLHDPLSGKSITPRRHGIHVDQQSMDWIGDRLIVGNDGGVWSTTDGGKTWENHNFGGLAIAQTYRGALDRRRPDVIIAGTQDTGTIRRDGWRWRWVQGGDGVGAVMSHKDPATHWLTATQSILVHREGGIMLALWRTRDAGLTFQRADLGIELTTGQWVPPLAQCPDTDHDVILFGARSLWKALHLFKIPTTRAFEAASPPAWAKNSDEMEGDPERDSDITAVAFAPGTRCQTYAFARGDGGVYLTTDGGKLWYAVGCLERRISALAFSSKDPSVLYATLPTYGRSHKKSDHIWRMSAPGEWDDVTPPFRGKPGIDQPFHTVAVVPRDERPEAPDLVFAGGDFGVWVSSNQGESWCRLRLDEYTPYPVVMDLKVHPVTRWVYAFTLGRGVFRLKNLRAAVSACDNELARFR